MSPRSAAGNAREEEAIYREDLAWIHHVGFREFSESAAPGIVAMLAGHGIAAGDIVDMGCGSGVLAEFLTRAGFRVTGIDVSPAMIALARRTAPQAHFICDRYDTTDLPPCDAIVAVGEVLNYGSAGELRRFICHAAGALRPGGVLLFDLAEDGTWPDSDERRAGGDDWSVIAIKRRNGRRLERRILTYRKLGTTIRRDDETHVIELFPRSEVLALLRENGFAVRVRRSYGRRRLPEGYAVYVCRKKRTRGGDAAAGLLRRERR